jgi:hypothetical protein
MTNLAAMCSTSADLAGVLVQFGGALTDSDATDVLSIGYVDDTDDTAADGGSKTEGLGNRQDREQYVIHCAAAVLDGDEPPDQLGAMTRVFAMFDAVGALCIGDSTLRGAVMTAGITTWTFRQDLTDGGAFARIRFDIDIDAYTRK